MSHAYGEVWSLAGQILGHFEYNGTVDVACSRVHLTQDEVREHWREDNSRQCPCEGKIVILWTNYGYGFYWLAKYCSLHMVITSGLDPEGSIKGHPFREKPNDNISS